MTQRRILAAILFSAVACVAAGGDVPAPLGALPSADAATSASSEQPVRLFPKMEWCDGEWTLRITGEQRLRYEERRDFSMNTETHPNSYSIGLMQTRMSFDLVNRSLIRVFLQVMDARQIGAREITDTNSSYFNIHQLFVDIVDHEASPLTLRVGSQEMDIGSRRLLESSSWSNLPTIFYGALAMYRSSLFDTDAFLVQPGNYTDPHQPSNVTGPPEPLNRVWLYGAHSTIKACAPGLLDLYYIGASDRDDDRTFPYASKTPQGVYGTASRHTVGARAYGPVWEREGCGTLRYDLEGAYQFGRLADEDISAYFAHADVSYEWDAPWKPKLTLLGNIASGDRNPNDGEINTFDPLYGTTHGPYGLIDFLRLQNMREIAVTATVNPTKKLKLYSGLHQFWLDSRTDSWYNTRGSSYAQDPTGQSGRDLGQEIDFTATYKLTANAEVEGGYAHFFDGRFADKNGRPDPANWLHGPVPAEVLTASTASRAGHGLPTAQEHRGTGVLARPSGAGS